MKYPVRKKTESGTQFKKRRIAWEKQHGKQKVKLWESDKTFARKLTEKKAPKFINKDAEMAGIPPQLRTKLPRNANGLVDHSKLLKPVFNNHDLRPRQEGEGECKRIPIPPHAEEPQSIRRMRTLTDEDDGGLLQNAEKELRESGRLDGESNGSDVTVELKKLNMTINGPINCVIRFCKEMAEMTLLREEMNENLFGENNE